MILGSRRVQAGLFGRSLGWKIPFCYVLTRAGPSNPAPCSRWGTETESQWTAWRFVRWKAATAATFRGNGFFSDSKRCRSASNLPPSVSIKVPISVLYSFLLCRSKATPSRLGFVCPGQQKGKPVCTKWTRRRPLPNEAIPQHAVSRLYALWKAIEWSVIELKPQFIRDVEEIGRTADRKSVV